jgi:hypothetical protein
MIVRMPGHAKGIEAVYTRLIETRQEFLNQRFSSRRIQLPIMMFSAEVAGGLAGDASLVKARVGKRDAKRPQILDAHMARQRYQRCRVYAPAEKNAYRNVAHEMAPNGILQRGAGCVNRPLT